MILLRRLTDPAALPPEPLIASVTLAELAGAPLVAEDDGERAARQAHLQQAEADFVLPVYTCDPDDFAGIDGPRVVAEPVPDGPG